MNNKILNSKSGFGDLFYKEKTGFLKKLEVSSTEINHFLCFAEETWSKRTFMKLQPNFAF